MKKGTKNNQKEPPTPDEEPKGKKPPAPKPKKSLGRFFFRGLIYSLFFILLLIASVGIVLEYYFPAEDVRVFAEDKLSQQLKVPLKIQKIGFSLLSGMKLENVILGSPPIAQVKQVVLDYDLRQLLQGKLVINQVLVDHPELTAVSKNGVWNFQPLLGLEKSAPAPKTQEKPAELPALPLAEIDIKEVTIRKASARLDQDGKIKAHINGLSLEARGKVNSNTVDINLKVLLAPVSDKPNIEFQSTGEAHIQSRLTTNLEFSANDLNRLLISGAVDMKNNLLRVKKSPLPSPNMKMQVNAEVLLKPETVNLKNFSMSLGKNNQIKVSGNVSSFSKDPAFELMIDKTKFQLSDLLSWGQQWLPPLSGRGLLKVDALKINGQLPGFSLKKLNISKGTLSTKNLWVKLPDHKAQLENLNTKVELKDISLNDAQLEKASANIKLQLKKGSVQEAEIKDWNQSLRLVAKGLNDIQLEFNTDIKSVHYNHPDAKEIFIPVHAEGSGHLKNNDVNNLKLSYRFGNLANGKVAGTAKNLGRDSVQLDQSLSMNLDEIASRVPKKFTASLANTPKGSVQVETFFKGKLDEKYFPINLEGKADFKVNKLSGHLKEPSIIINNLNTGVSFPIEFIADKGVIIPNLDFHLDLQNVNALNTWQVGSLKLDSKVAMKAFHNLKPEFGTLPIQIGTQISLSTLKGSQPALSLADFDTDLTLEADLSANDVRNARVKGSLSLKNLAAIEMLKIDSWRTRFNLDVHDKSLTRVRLSQKTQINKPSFQQDDLQLGLKAISLESSSRQNLKDGEVNLDTFLFQSPGLVNAKLKATLKRWGKDFNVEGKVENLQLGSLWNQVPETFKPGLESIKTDGTLNITLKTQGKLPATPQDTEDPPPAWKQFLVPANTGDPAPVQIETEVELRNGIFEHPKKQIRAETLNTKVNLTFKDGQGGLSGFFSGQLEGLGGIVLKPDFKFDYALEDLNKFAIKTHNLTLTNLGAKHSIKGYVKGFNPFITGQRKANAKELLSRLDIQIANVNTVDIGQANSKELIEDLKAQGLIAAKINLDLSAGKLASLDGNLNFDKFNLQLPSGIALNNLTGTFPFSKTVLLGHSSLKEKPGDFSPAQKNFFTPLRNFSRYKNNIRADSLEVKGQALKDIGLDMLFKDNRLMAEKFIFDVLGGSMGGNLFLIQDQEGPVIRFSTEFAEIDASKLLEIPTDENIDSKVGGNMQVELKVNTGTKDQPVSLDQLKVKIAITQIGAQTLDRLLLFIDPEESKPAIMDTRAKLKLAGPHRVQILLENGNLNVEAWLKSDLLGIFKAPELKRVPVAALKRFNAIHEQLQALKSLQQISNFISARGIQFEDEKMLLLH